MKPNMKNTKVKTIVMAVIVVGILALAFGTTHVSVISAQTKGTPVPFTALDTIKEQNPTAVIAKGDASEILKGISLMQLSQTSQSLRADASKDPQTSTKDTGVSLKVSYGNKDLKDIVAITLKNASPKTISVNTFVISGYLHNDVPGSYVETVYRPIISDPSDVAGATTTTPQEIAPGESLTSYIQDTLNADGYTAMACYSYDPADPATHYCTSMPVTWLK